MCEFEKTKTHGPNLPELAISYSFLIENVGYAIGYNLQHCCCWSNVRLHDFATNSWESFNADPSGIMSRLRTDLCENSDTLPAAWLSYGLRLLSRRRPKPCNSGNTTG